MIFLLASFKKCFKSLFNRDSRIFASRHIENIVKIAEKHGWLWVSYQPTTRMLSFTKVDSNNHVMKVNVYYTKMTVGTSLTHPFSGPTQLFRKNCTMDELNRIFINPRYHTDKGYYKKR